MLVVSLLLLTLIRFDAFDSMHDNRWEGEKEEEDKEKEDKTKREEKTKRKEREEEKSKPPPAQKVEGLIMQAGIKPSQGTKLDMFNKGFL